MFGRKGALLSEILRLKSAILFSIMIIFVGTASALLISCDGNPTNHDGPDPEAPDLYSLIAPDSLIRGLPDTTVIHISVKDPQGVVDIDSVFFTVTRPDGTSNGIIFLMFDDGQNGGDSISGDSVFTQGIQSPTLQSQLGDYTFHFRAKDFSSNYSNNIDKIITAYDSPNPVLSRPFANQYDMQRQRMFMSVRVVDVQGQADIDSAWVEITYLDESSLVGSYILNDLGFYGDSTAYDKIYSGEIGAAPDSIFQAGNYQLQFGSVDYDSHQAAPVFLTIIVEPPAI